MEGVVVWLKIMTAQSSYNQKQFLGGQHKAYMYMFPCPVWSSGYLTKCVLVQVIAMSVLENERNRIQHLYVMVFQVTGLISVLTYIRMLN